MNLQTRKIVQSNWCWIQFIILDQRRFKFLRKGWELKSIGCDRLDSPLARMTICAAEYNASLELEKCLKGLEDWQLKWIGNVRHIVELVHIISSIIFKAAEFQFKAKEFLFKAAKLLFKAAKFQCMVENRNAVIELLMMKIDFSDVCSVLVGSNFRDHHWFISISIPAVLPINNGWTIQSQESLL